jgi:hypothetical protein
MYPRGGRVHSPKAAVSVKSKRTRPEAFADLRAKQAVENRRLKEQF